MGTLIPKNKALWRAFVMIAKRACSHVVAVSAARVLYRACRNELQVSALPEME